MCNTVMYNLGEFVLQLSTRVMDGLRVCEAIYSNRYFLHAYFAPQKSSAKLLPFIEACQSENLILIN